MVELPIPIVVTGLEVAEFVSVSSCELNKRISEESSTQCRYTILYQSKTKSLLELSIPRSNLKSKHVIISFQSYIINILYFQPV